jgi:hypothetical protein
MTERWTITPNGYSVEGEEPVDLEPEPELPQDKPRKGRPRKRRVEKDAP